MTRGSGVIWFQPKMGLALNSDLLIRGTWSRYQLVAQDHIGSGVDRLRLVEFLEHSSDGSRRLRVGEMVNADSQRLGFSIDDEIGIMDEEILEERSDIIRS